MRTYGELFAIGEFRALIISRALVIASLCLASLALATIVYDETGSPVLSALALFGGSLLTLLGSVTALSLSDRLDARSAILLVIAVTGVQAALQAVPGLPLVARFLLLALSYLVPAVVGGSLIRLLRSIFPEDGFILGRATLNVGVGLMQVVAFASGAFLLRVLSTRGLFLLAAVLMVAAGAVLLAGVAARPAMPRSGNVLAETHRVNVDVLRSPRLRPILLSAWIPNGLIAGCEALFVPYGGTAWSGFLFATAAAGMLLGDVVVGRVLTAPLAASGHPRCGSCKADLQRRDRLLTPLRLLLAVPYLGFLLHPPVELALALGFVASVGYSASLALQERLAHEANPTIEGQVFGLFGNGQMVGQSLGALVGGMLATWLPPATAMGLLGAASVLVTLSLSSGLRRSQLSSAAVA